MSQETMKKKKSRAIDCIAAAIILTNSFYFVLHCVGHPLMQRSIIVNAISPMSSIVPLGNFLLPLFAGYAGYGIFRRSNRWRLIFVIYQLCAWVFAVCMSFLGSTLSWQTIVTGVLPVLFIFTVFPAAYIFLLTRRTLVAQFS